MYGELKKGEFVVLVGERYEKYASVRFEFLCHARHEETGKEWIELWGGRRGYEHVTAVSIDAVRRINR